MAQTALHLIRRWIICDSETATFVTVLRVSRLQTTLMDDFWTIHFKNLLRSYSLFNFFAQIVRSRLRLFLKRMHRNNIQKINNICSASSTSTDKFEVSYLNIRAFLLKKHYSEKKHHCKTNTSN